MVHENFPKWRRPRVALSELRTKSLPQSVGVRGRGRVGNSKQYIRTPGTPLQTHTEWINRGAYRVHYTNTSVFVSTWDIYGI